MRRAPDATGAGAPGPASERGAVPGPARSGTADERDASLIAGDLDTPVAAPADAPAGAVATGDAEAPIEDETAPPAGYLGNAIAAAVPLVLGVAGLWLAVDMGLGSFGDPGPGLWPALICVVLAGLSVALLAGGKRFHDAEAFTRRTVHVVAAAALMLGLVLAMPWIGFEIPTAVVAFVWLKWLGGERWLTSALLAVGITAVLWLLFVQLFAIRLPHLI